MTTTGIEIYLHLYVGACHQHIRTCPLCAVAVRQLHDGWPMCDDGARLHRRRSKLVAVYMASDPMAHARLADAIERAVRTVLARHTEARRKA